MEKKEELIGKQSTMKSVVKQTGDGGDILTRKAEAGCDLKTDDPTAISYTTVRSIGDETRGLGEF